MAPLQYFTAIVTTLLAASCSAFVVPCSTQTSPRHTSALGHATASATPGLHSSRDLSLGTTRLSFCRHAHVNDAGGRDARLVGPGRQTAAGALKASGVDEEQGGGGNDLTAIRRALVLAVWLPFAAYAFGPFSPGSIGDPKDFEILTHLYDTVAPPNAIFVNLFNAMGFLPALVASILVGGGSFQKGRQPVPAPPFVFGAFALGFFAAGPYLALRNYLPEPPEEGEDMSTVEKVLTSKFFAAPLVALSAYTLVGLASSVADPEAVASFPELFWSSRAAHVTTLDFFVLSAAIIDPIREDMRRRGVEPELAKVALFSVPLIGPALWALVRPPVES